MRGAVAGKYGSPAEPGRRFYRELTKSGLDVTLYATEVEK